MYYKFYDTSSLLLKANHLWDKDDEKVLISYETLRELEKIKTSSAKDEQVKYSARKLLREMDKNSDKYFVYHTKYSNCYNSDECIVEDAKTAFDQLDEEKQANFIFVTNDLALKHLSKRYFKNVESYKEEEDEYFGYVNVNMSYDEMTDFYSNLDKNIYNLNTNEYLLIHDETTGEVIDKYCWTGKIHRKISFATFTSSVFGQIKPVRDDAFQACAVDSLVNNQITMIKGKSGSGKTTLSLAYLWHMLEKGKINKIIIFCNTVASKNAARLGFYPGDKNDKLLDSQIGNMLSSKLGDVMPVENMIADGSLVLLPFSDIRGYDTSGMKAGIYISEAQNLDIELMRLALQRIGEDSICIIDGDDNAQVDDINFSGNNNGMKRVSQVFRGQEFYGEVSLQKIHRSKIAQIAEKL